MKMAMNNFKNLTPEERIKRLKELEEQKKRLTSEWSEQMREEKKFDEERKNNLASLGGKI